MPATSTSTPPDPLTTTITSNNPTSSRTSEHTRPLYIRHVPESIWLKLHDNANRSRLRLGAYVVKLLQDCEPVQP